jgi:hypothetical protein
MLWPFGIFYRDLGYFMTIGYILYSLGTFFPVLESCTKKTLATLLRTATTSFAEFTASIFENSSPTVEEQRHGATRVT